MTYTNSTIVNNFTGSVSYTDLGFVNATAYNAWLDNTTIPYCDAVIDEYCDVPSGFFAANGTNQTNETYDYINGNGGKVYLKYAPMLNCTAVRIDNAGYGSAASWQLLTSTQYIADLDSGIITLVGVNPSKYERSIMVTYQAGYSTMPPLIGYVSTKLCSNLVHEALQKKISPVMQAGDFTIRLVHEDPLTPDLKAILDMYKRSFFAVG